MDGDHTVLIVTDESEVRDGWLVAMESILQALQKHNLAGLKVEIMDPCARLQFSGSADLADTPLGNAWPTLETQVIGILGVGSEWETLGLNSREWETSDVYDSTFGGPMEKDKRMSTVTVGVTRAASVEWQAAMYAQLKELLEAYPDVEMAVVRSSMGVDRQNPAGKALRMKEFAGPVDMGAGFGIGERSATLGGYVTVEYQGQTITMGVTTHTAIETDDMTDDEKANGYKPCLTRTTPEIVYPSDSDTERTCRIRSEAAAHCQAQLQGSSPDLSETAIIENTNRRLGSVFASSGQHRSSSSAMDWALLLIDPFRAGTNKTPPNDPFHTNGFGPTDTTIEQANDANSQSHAFGTAGVFKLGSNGGSTGRISPFKACIHRSGVVQKAMVVEQGRFSGCYMLPGDEGCWGLNLLGAWDHLGVGVERGTGACYVVPTSELFVDVERRTGVKILSPVLGW